MSIIFPPKYANFEKYIELYENLINNVSVSC